MARLMFNRRMVLMGRSIEQPSQELVKNTLSLHNASIEDALKYGGDLTRAAIGAMDLRGDRKYMAVDTKVHMLMPGFCPAIPGWHTDGVPRGRERDPAGKGAPDIWRQEDSDLRPPRFHLLVTGQGCLTEFITDAVVLDLPEEPTPALYRLMTEQVSKLAADGACTPWTAPSCTAVEWDWWSIHQGIWATKHEWRFLIRVTETDHVPPKTDLRDIIRTQIQVYAPAHFGW